MWVTVRFAEGAAAADSFTDARPVEDLSAAAFSPWMNEPRDPDGRWTVGGGTSVVSAGPDTADPPPDIPGPHAPDGTPIELAAFRKGGRPGWVKALGSLVGGVERLLRERLPEDPEPEEQALPPPSKPNPAEPPVAPDPRASQKLDNALSNYQTRRYTTDNQTFQLDKAGMRHILERHAPEYWNRSPKSSQTFFDPGTSIEDIPDVVRDILGQNRDAIIAKPSAHEWDLTGTSRGRNYKLWTYNGRVTQVFPLP